MMIQRLLYRSDCTLPGAPDEVDRGVAHIVDVSGSANEAAGVTGALMLSAGVFLQVLEGPPEAVETTFERICRDLRHRHVRLLELAVAEDRVFGDWAMVQVTPTQQLARLCPSLGTTGTRLDSTTANAAVQIMRTMLLTGTPGRAVPAKNGGQRRDATAV